MTDPISLPDFIDAEHASLDEFATWYADMKKHRGTKEDWPDQQNAADWWDEYIAWAQS